MAQATGASAAKARRTQNAVFWVTTVGMLAYAGWFFITLPA
jgi:hypothetical protein